MKSLAVFLIATVLAQSNVDVRYPGQEEQAWALEVFERINEARGDEGLDALTLDPSLSLLAFQHAAEMADRGIVTHHSFEYGIGTQTRVKFAFPRVYQFAENVGVNGDPERLHRGMMLSPRHRINRMEPSFTHVGVGVVRGRDRRLFLTEIFVRVVAETQLELDRLYPQVPRELLPVEEPTTGQVTGETIRIPAPTADDPEYWTHLGIDAYDAGSPRLAVEHFRRALEIDPGYRFARFDLGRALTAAGQPAEAIAELDRFLTDYPDDLDAWSARGSASLLLQDYSAAEEAFRRVLSDRVTDAGAWYNLGLALEFQEHAEDAENAYAQALHLDPTLRAAAIGLQRVRG